MAFSVDKTDGNELTFFIIDTGNGYSSDSYKGRVEVGRLVSDETPCLLRRATIIG